LKHYERISSDGIVIDRAIGLEPGDTPEDFAQSPIKKVLAADIFAQMEVGDIMRGRDNTIIKRTS
jgi:hypothetical protein